jgi:integrase
MGIPDRHIQDILRHSDVSVTRKAYIKRVPARSVAAMEKLQEMLAMEMMQ